MDQSERRVVGSLLLLSGLTFLIVGLYTGQLAMVLQIVEEPLRLGEGVASPAVRPTTLPPSTTKEVAVDAFEYGFNPSTLTASKSD